MEEDWPCNKRTIVTVCGRALPVGIPALVATAFLTVIVLVIAKQISPMALISLLALPQAFVAFRILRKRPHRSELARVCPLHRI